MYFCFGNFQRPPKAIAVMSSGPRPALGHKIVEKQYFFYGSISNRNVCKVSVYNMHSFFYDFLRVIDAAWTVFEVLDAEAEKRFYGTFFVFFSDVSGYNIFYQ